MKSTSGVPNRQTGFAKRSRSRSGQHRIAGADRAEFRSSAEACRRLVLRSELDQVLRSRIRLRRTSEAVRRELLVGGAEDARRPEAGGQWQVLQLPRR